ncbi:MAG: T9SS type A sorting domain-containing protein [Candidatus Neomarinimicrobiota bacterium]
MASFSAPLAGLGGGAGVVYASGFLAPTETDSAFTLILATPSGYTVELPLTETALDVDYDGSNVPSSFTLNQNYPNPFNPSTSISFSIPETANVVVEIRDINGRLIKSLSNSIQKAGLTNLIWNSTNEEGLNVSAGVYFYSVKVNSNIQTKKMILLK